MLKAYGSDNIPVPMQVEARLMMQDTTVAQRAVERSLGSSSACVSIGIRRARQWGAHDEAKGAETGLSCDRRLGVSRCAAPIDLRWVEVGRLVVKWRRSAAGCLTACLLCSEQLANLKSGRNRKRPFPPQHSAYFGHSYQTQHVVVDVVVVIHKKNNTFPTSTFTFPFHSALGCGGACSRASPLATCGLKHYSRSHAAPRPCRRSLHRAPQLYGKPAPHP